MGAMEGERHSADVIDPAPLDAPAVDLRPSSESFEAIDLEEDASEDAPPSVESIDIEFDEAEPSSVVTLLAITEEHWSLDTQRESLKLAATKERPASDEGKGATDAQAASRTLVLPTPFDFGARPTATATAPRSVPPPLPLPPARPAVRSTADADELRTTLPGNPPNASKRPPPLPARPEAPASAKLIAAAAVPGPNTPATDAGLVDLLRARIEWLSGTNDRVGLARAHVELAIVYETLGHDADAHASAEAALGADPDHTAAHAILRRRLHSRTQLVPMLRHLERELAVASNDALAAELWVERARLFEAGGRAIDAREAWEVALGHHPLHAAALKGLEGDLTERAFADDADADAWEGLVVHLGRMSEAFGEQPELAGWLHVERAHILEWHLGRSDAARAAFERALRLDPRVGPTRDAFTLHVYAHGDWARLATLLDDEALLEPVAARSARLELDAACIAQAKLGDEAHARTLLERAAARAPTAPAVDRYVLDELVRSYDTSADIEDAARARRMRLPFFTEPHSRAHELRRLASLEEQLGNIPQATLDIEEARTLCPHDATLVEELDRLYQDGGRDDDRVRLWHELARKSEDPTKRARALTRAATLASLLERHDEARSFLRSAWASLPGDGETFDGLARQQKPLSLAPDQLTSVRALVDLYEDAARTTRDKGRRVAYLEKVALLWEEVLDDQPRAALAFEAIHALEPSRLGAIIGLSRTAARVGDDRANAASLIKEADILDDGAAVLALRVRAATVLARVDPERALVIVAGVVEQDPHHAAARALETRLHAEAGRWTAAAQSLRARIEIASPLADHVALWLALAEIQEARLHTPKDAVHSLEQARALDPSHPVPPLEIARILEQNGDPEALCLARQTLAEHATTSEERARHLTHAGVLAEWDLNDLPYALTLYRQALAHAPGDEVIAHRVLRVLARRTVTARDESSGARFANKAWNEFLEQLATLGEHAPAHERAAHAFQLACLLVTAKTDVARATRIAEGAFAHEPRDVPALRLLELIARRENATPALARALRLQGEHFACQRARLASLWGTAHLETWKLTGVDSLGTYTRILELDSTDPSALSAALRLSLASLHKGEPAARKAAIAALRSLAACTEDPAARIPIELRLGILLADGADQSAGDEATAYAREAATCLTAVLTLDPLSVTAATTLARLAGQLSDTSAAITAALALADLAVHPTARARYRFEAAKLWFEADEPPTLSVVAQVSRRDVLEDPTDHAARWLESALEADPNATYAATLLARVRRDQGKRESLLEVFRAALVAATAPDAIVLLGTEVATIARDEAHDIDVAVEAMRKVRVAVPSHIPSRFMLAELFLTQRAWPEAIETLDEVVAHATLDAPRLTALFALASVYDKVLSRPDDAERALRAALSIDSEHPRALRALVHHLASGQDTNHETNLEIAGLLERLARVEKEPHARCDILIELADIRVAAKDPKGAEEVLIDAVASTPDHPRAFARLTKCFRDPSAPFGLDAVSFARALNTVMGRAKQIGTTDARWFATLGHIEIERLNRLRDGIAHLSEAVRIDPNFHETRFELAGAYVRLGSHEDAIKTVLAMMSPVSHSLIALSDPARALELLEHAYSDERRPEEATVVRELRALTGALDEPAKVALRSRRLSPLGPQHVALDRQALVNHAVPNEGRSVWLDIAQAIAGIETRILRADLAEIGVNARERLSRRSGHPSRNLFDRLMKLLGLSDIELVVSKNVTRTRVIAQDTLWVIVPQSLTERPENAQGASIARALARIALNVPWLEELPPAHIHALLGGAARCVHASFVLHDLETLPPQVLRDYESAIAKELGRKQRQQLEKLVPSMSAFTASEKNGIEPFIAALARAELRIAYVLMGDLTAALDDLRSLDSNFREATQAEGRKALGATLDHPFAGDLVQFALSTESTALRRRVGSTWSG
jgi:tetratricopeptide (TPR) repeat protein